MLPYMSKQQSENQLRNNNRFDFIRLLAALLVLFSHCYPLAGRSSEEPLGKILGIEDLGSVGVAIFFVLSGYLVSQSLQRSPTLLNFAKRRALRIFPALAMVCILCVFVIGPWMTQLPLSIYFTSPQTWEYLRSASGWIIKFSLPQVFTDNPYPNAVNGSLWTLPCEIRFYLVLALLSLLPLHLRIKSVLLLVWLSCAWGLRPELPKSGDFMGLDFSYTKLGLFFAIGIFWACWKDRWVSSSLIAALAITIFAAVIFNGSWRLLFIYFGFSSLIIWLALNAKWLPMIPKRMGDWSYGVYLYAFPCQQLLAHFKVQEISFIGYVLSATCLTTLMAAFSWHFLEKQVLKLK